MKQKKIMKKDNKKKTLIFNLLKIFFKKGNFSLFLMKSSEKYKTRNKK